MIATIYCSPIHNAGQPHRVPQVYLHSLGHGDKTGGGHDLNLGLSGLHRILVILVSQVILNTL